MRTTPFLIVLVCSLAANAAGAADVVPPAAVPTPAPAKDLVVPPAVVPQAGRGENLAGQVDSSRGEGRRNENIQVNLVDTNAVRELNTRVGATATIVEEFRAEGGYYSSEYGNATLNPLHVEPQRGASFHGNTFWSHLNSAFTARSFFQAGPVKAARRNQYGIAANLQVWRGGYFTTALSQDKNRGNVNGNVLIPLPAEREPLATDPAVRAAVERLINAWPDVSPNRTDIAARALNTNSFQSTDTNLATGQLSQSVGPRDRFAARYAFTGQHVDAFQFTKGQNPITDNKNHNARWTWNRAFHATMTSDVSVGFDRQGTLLRPSGDAVGPVSVNGLQGLGPPSVVPINRAINRFRAQGAIRRQQAFHAWTLGGGVNRQHYNGFESEDSRPTYIYRDDFGRNAIQNLRMGTPSIYSQSFGIFARSFRNWELQAYAGDRWQVSSKLTLNYGVRWEPWTRPVDAMGLSKLTFGSDWQNTGGHLGLAYRLPRGVLRGSFAVVNGQLFPITYGQDRLNPPHNFSVAILAPDILNPLKGLSAADLDGSGRAVRFDIDPNLATPYSYQYNLSWEAELAGKWKAQLGYVGSRTHKLFVTYQLNRGRFVPGIPFATSTTNLRRADQTSYQRFHTLNGSRAFYDAGRATLTSPRWHGGALNASYWFSKSIDLGADYAVTGGGQERWGQAGQTETGLQKDMRGLSNFDQPHALLVQGSWEAGSAGPVWLRRLGKGWIATSVLLLKSGTPFTVDAGSDGPGFGNVDGTGGDRPNVLDPSILGRTVGNPDTSSLLLPRSAFAFIHAPDQLAGNLGRNTFRKGRIANWNASLARTWALPRDWSITTVAEAINLSNTAQFAEPGKGLTSPNFGQITNTLNDGRTFRFSLRMAF